jgi:hypothetical protein
VAELRALLVGWEAKVGLAIILRHQASGRPSKNAATAGEETGQQQQKLLFSSYFLNLLNISSKSSSETVQK